MKTSQRLASLAVFLAALAFAPAAWAQSDPAAGGESSAIEPVLKAIPEDALGFVLVNDLAQTDKAISKLGAAVQAPVPSVLSLFKRQAGIREGLDENGSAAVALLPDAAAPADGSKAAKPKFTPIVLFPVTDYKKFIAQFQPSDATGEITGVTVAGHSLIVGHKDSFAVFTLPDHKEQLGRALASKKGVDALIGSFKPWIARHLVSLVATPTGTKLALQAAVAALKRAQDKLAKSPNAPQAAQATMILKLYEGLVSKAAEEVEAVALGMNLDDHSNLFIDKHTTFVAGGSWAAAMAHLQPPPEVPFAGLPAVPFVLAGEFELPKQFAQGLASFSADSVSQMNEANGGKAMDAAQRKQYIDATESMMKGVHSESFVLRSAKPGEPLLDGALGVMKVDDAKSFLERYQTALEQMSGALKSQEKPAFRFTDVKKIEIDGRPGLSLSIDLSGVLAEQKNPAAGKVLPLMFGPSAKMTSHLLAADDRTLLITIGSEEPLKEALAEFKSRKSGFAAEPDVAKTLGLLPPRAQLVGLVSIKGYADFIGRILATTGLPINLPGLPEMPPVGFAAEADGHGVSTQLVLPVQTLAGISHTIHAAMGQPAPPAK